MRQIHEFDYVSEVFVFVIFLLVILCDRKCEHCQGMCGAEYYVHRSSICVFLSKRMQEIQRFAIKRILNLNNNHNEQLHRNEYVHLMTRTLKHYLSSKNYEMSAGAWAALNNFYLKFVEISDKRWRRNMSVQNKMKWTTWTIFKTTCSPRNYDNPNTLSISGFECIVWCACCHRHFASRY